MRKEIAGGEVYSQNRSDAVSKINKEEVEVYSPQAEKLMGNFKNFQECSEFVKKNLSAAFSWEGENLSNMEIEAVAALLYCQPQKYKDKSLSELPDIIEQNLIELVHKPALPSFLNSAGIKELFLSYNRNARKGRVGQKEWQQELKGYPLLQSLLKHQDSTAYRLQCINTTKSGVGFSATNGLAAPTNSMSHFGMSKNIKSGPKTKSINLDVRTGAAETIKKVSLTPAQKIEVAIGKFLENHASEILEAATPTARRLIAAKILSETGLELKDLAKISRESMELLTGHALVVASARNNPEKVLSYSAASSIAEKFCEAAAVHFGCQINLLLAGRIKEYSEAEEKQLFNDLINCDDPAELPKIREKMVHAEKIKNRLSAYGTQNPLTSMDTALYEDFPILSLELMDDYGLYKESFLSSGIKEYKEWKKATDRVYETLGNMVGCLDGGPVMKIISPAFSMATKIEENGAKEVAYTTGELLSEAFIETGFKKVIAKVMHEGNMFNLLSKSDFLTKNGLFEDQYKTVARQLDFIMSKVPGKISRTLLDIN